MSKRKRKGTSRKTRTEPVRAGSPPSGGPQRRPRRAMRWLFGIVLLIAAGVGGWFALQSTDRSIPRIAEPADRKSLDPQVLALIEKQLQVVRTSPGDASVRGELALMYAGNSMWGEARAAFSHARELDGSEPQWAYYRAVALREAGDADGALVEIRDLVKGYPENAAYQYRFGYLLMEVGHVEEAEQAFLAARRLRPDAPQSMVGLAKVHLNRREYEQARQLLEPIAEELPDYKEAAYALGRAYRGLGLRDEAREYLKRGVNAVAQFIPDRDSKKLQDYRVGLAGMFNLANEMLKHGDHAGALKILEECYAKRPNDPEVINNVALAFRLTGRVARAKELLLRAIEIDPTSFPSYINLATCCMQMQQPEEALRFSDLAVEHGPRISKAHLVRCKSLARLGRFEETLEAATTTLRYDAREAEAHQVAGEACMRLLRYPEAKVHLEEAVRMLPDALLVRLQLVSVCVKLGLLDDAGLALEAARNLAPEHPKVIEFTRELEALRKP